MSHYRVTYRIEVEATSIGAVADLIMYKARETFPDGRWVDVEKQLQNCSNGGGKLWRSMIPDWLKNIMLHGDHEDLNAASRQLKALRRRQQFRCV